MQPNNIAYRDYIDDLLSRPDRPFSPIAEYDADGDRIEFFAKPDLCYAVRIDALLRGLPQPEDAGDRRLADQGRVARVPGDPGEASEFPSRDPRGQDSARPYLPGEAVVAASGRDGIGRDLPAPDGRGGAVEDRSRRGGLSVGVDRLADYALKRSASLFSTAWNRAFGRAVSSAVEEECEDGERPS